jgi:hypothetical protein
VDKDANLQPIKAHLNSLLFIFPPAHPIENVEPTFFNQHFSDKSCITIFQEKTLDSTFYGKFHQYFS